MKPEFSPQTFNKYLNKNFMKIRPVGSELFHADIGMDGHDEVNSQFLQLCEHT